MNCGGAGRQNDFAAEMGMNTTPTPIHDTCVSSFMPNRNGACGTKNTQQNGRKAGQRRGMTSTRKDGGVYFVFWPTRSSTLTASATGVGTAYSIGYFRSPLFDTITKVHTVAEKGTSGTPNLNAVLTVQII